LIDFARCFTVTVLLLAVAVLCSGCQQIIGAEQVADVAFALARSAELRGDTEAAIRTYDEVVRKDPGRTDAFHRLALLYDKKGNSAAAEGCYNEALQRSPEVASLHCDYGYHCYLDARFVPAEEHLRRAIELEPDFGRAHNNLGLLLARTQRSAEALEQFARAGASVGEAHLNLATAALMDGQLDEAARLIDVASRDSTVSAPKLTLVRNQLARAQHASAAPAARLVSYESP
jgi:Tfp pilus assembly protein PilF